MSAVPDGGCALFWDDSDNNILKIYSQSGNAFALNPTYLLINNLNVATKCSFYKKNKCYLYNNL